MIGNAMNFRVFSIIHKTNIRKLQSRGLGVESRRKPQFADLVIHFSAQNFLISP